MNSIQHDAVSGITMVHARDLPDLWYLAVSACLDHGRRFVIDKGSYAGQTRLEFDYFVGHCKFPMTKPALPDIPSHLNIPNPVEHDYVYGGLGYERSYVEYVMSARKAPEESYTYGERLTKFRVSKDKINWRARDDAAIVDTRRIDGATILWEDSTVYVNQIEWVIKMYKDHGHRNNQMVLQVAMPDDCILLDPPCLRQIDTRIQDGKLRFIITFRSWDLWGGFPANLAGIQELKAYMASEIGVEDGDMIVESKGLHLYGYVEELAKLRCMKDIAVDKDKKPQGLTEEDLDPKGDPIHYLTKDGLVTIGHKS